MCRCNKIAMVKTSCKVYFGRVRNLTFEVGDLI